MKYHPSIHLFCLGVFSLLPTLSLQGASIFTETWSEAGNLQGWSSSTLGLPTGTNSHVVSGGAVNFTVQMGAGPFNRGYQLAASYSVSNPSGGAFAGNLVMAGVRSVQFDFALDSDSLGTAENPGLFLFMGGVDANTGLNNYWEYRVTPPTINTGFITVAAPLTDSAGWVQTLGSGSFTEATQNVQTWAINYRRFQPSGPNSGFSASGRVDNFALSTAIPEPSLPILMSVCGGFALMRRRRA
jgi:hypothetical protein